MTSSAASVMPKFSSIALEKYMKWLLFSFNWLSKSTANSENLTPVVLLVRYKCSVGFTMNRQNKFTKRNVESGLQFLHIHQQCIHLLSSQVEPGNCRIFYDVSIKVVLIPWAPKLAASTLSTQISHLSLWINRKWTIFLYFVCIFPVLTQTFLLMRMRDE